MLKNYLLITLRNLLRNKSYVIINTFGLGIALACCVAAYLIVAFNIEFDSFHAEEKVKDVYRVHAHFLAKDGKDFQQIMSPYPLAPTAAQEISGIETYTRFISWNGYMRNGTTAFSEGMAFVDSTFFDMFDFPLVAGTHQAFKDKYSIFVSEELAKKYFGDEEAVGKTLILNFANEKEVSVIVGGVLAKVPVNSAFGFNALLRIEHFFDINLLDVNNWGDWRDPSTFFKITPSADPVNIGKQLAKYVPVRNELKKDATVKEYKLESFKSNFNWEQVRGSYINLRNSLLPMVVFVSMASMILLIACFNLTNTSIALTGKRLKEVGVRKTIGAARYQIVSQFLLETLITIVMALVVGLIMAQFIVPAFTTMWNLPYGIKDLNGVNLFITLIMLVFLAALLAGMYPALYNSKFKPVMLLKGSVKIQGTNMLTRTLVAVQFALSVIVLVSGVMFIRNTKFQEKIKFGYDKEKVILVDVQNQNEFEGMRDVVSTNPKVQNIAVSDHHVGYSNYEFPVTVDTSKYTSRLMGVGKNYFETMGFTFKQGRSFNLDNQSDQGEAVIVNEAFLRKVGMTEPIDKIIVVHDVRRHIIGVIDNHIDNLYRAKEPEPFVFYPSTPQTNKLMLVRVEKEDLGETQKYLEATWKKLFPTKPFQSRFQEDVVLEDTKKTNGNLEKIFLFLTVLGGILSASGIFSLASLNIARRTKEIGIRKALGASVSNVVLLLNREFIVILSIAAILGGVGGFYATKLLMDEIYAYHIAVGIVPIVLCGVAVFAVGILTTSSTIFKAARANPVDTLRNE
jgi:putative ABC transport system permease protein